MGGLIRDSVTVASGLTNNNIIDGQVFTRLARPALVKFSASQQIVAGSNLVVDINVGNTIVTQALVPNVAAQAGVVDADRDKFPAAVGAANDEIQIRVRETTSGAGADGILNFSVEISDIA